MYPFRCKVIQVLYPGMNSEQSNKPIGRGIATTSMTDVLPDILTINPPMQQPQA